MAEVVEVPAEATHDLRRRVLRQHQPGTDVRYAEDDRPGAFHLAVRDGDGDGFVAIGTFFPEATHHRPGATAVRLRGMAVDPERRGRGLGRLLLEAAVARLRRDGVDVLWANARDVALDFYVRHGFEVVGDGFTAIGLPHHVVVLDLDRPAPVRAP